ncbi:MAG: tetratricopeptide repeat protein [bacterium]|nr:tetratricopeptide repeat protein [bacterium]
MEESLEPPPSRWRALLPLLVIAAGLAAYHNSFSGAFILDDGRNIVDRTQIRQLWPIGETLSSTRRPVVQFTFAVNYALGELDVRGYHAFNLGIHLLAALTLGGIVRRTLQGDRLRAGHGKAAPWLALSVALLWVVHPFNTQAVTYIVQRGESLMALFYLLTLYGVIRGASSGSGRRLWYGAAVLCCALGMATKQVMGTAPIVILLYDRVFLSSSWSEVFRRRWALHAGLVSTWLVLVGLGSWRVLDPSSTGTAVGFGFKGITPLEYALTQPGVIAHYLRLSFWPHPLCLDYVWPVVRDARHVLLSGLFVAALVLLTIWAMWRRPALGFVGACFFVVLGPTSSFIPIRDVIFEHRMYLPLAAVIVLTVLLVHAAWVRVMDRMAVARGWRALLAGVLVTAAAGGLGWRTVSRNRAYQSEITMWLDVLETSPHNARAHCDLGIAYRRAGKTDDALAHYRQAVELVPDHFKAWYNLGNIQLSGGRIDEAIEAYRQTLRIRPRDYRAHHNLGLALERSGDLDRAVAHHRQSTLIKPDFVTGHMSWANMLAKRGRFTEAVERYEKALRLAPDYYRGHYNLGLALVKLNRLSQAANAFRRTLLLKPDHKGARRELDRIETRLNASPN